MAKILLLEISILTEHVFLTSMIYPKECDLRIRFCLEATMNKFMVGLYYNSGGIQIQDCIALARVLMKIGGFKTVFCICVFDIYIYILQFLVFG